jgi:hypothetical protein
MFSQTAHISGVFRDGPELNRQRFPLFNPDAGQRVETEQAMCSTSPRTGGIKSNRSAPRT